MISKPLLKADLDHVLSHTASLWRELAGARLFITGGTGFFGKWLLESIAAANDALGCGVNATVLSRTPRIFLAGMPHLAERSEFTWVAANVTDFPFPAERHDYALHLATATSAHLDRTQPLEMLATKFNSIRRVLDFARHCGARRMLVTSSGAVYGPQPADLERIPEDYPGAPDPLKPTSAYGTGKRLIEQICALTPEVDCVIARCFSFIGPHLPFDARFAAGNFLRDALNGGPVVVQGDGQAVRSYLYAADLIIWLLTLLLRGTPGRAYNVGSDQEVSILELAHKVAVITGKNLPVDIKSKLRETTENRYVPNVSRSRAELGLQIHVSLHQALQRTYTWTLHNEDVNP